MTCIVGIEHKDNVYMACDSAGTDEYYNFCTTAETKVFYNTGTLMGMCGSFRLGQLLQYSLKIPDFDPRETDMNWLVNDYIDAVRHTLEEKGHIIKGEHTDEGIPEGDFLLGFRGKLYIVEGNFQVLRVSRGYVATGCGASYALGVMHYQMNHLPAKQRDPIEMLERALEAASEHSAGCAPPHHVFQLKPDGTVEKLV